MSNKAAACDAVGEVYLEPVSEENKGAAVALPESDGFMGQSLGGLPSYSAEGEATLRACLAVSEALVHDLAKDLERVRAQRDEAVAALEKLREAADDSDGACYGTLSTSFVRGIADEALASLKEQAA